MQRITRRTMVKSTLVGGALLGLQGSGRLRAEGPNSEVRIGLLGLGGIDVEGSVGGRGRQLLQTLEKVPGAKVVALCDVDETILQNGVELLKKQGQQVTAYKDMRRVFDDKNIDAVFVALPNHWHALATIWACQAGKDVYVEKPFSHDIWEGRQMVAAARKYDRIVQTGMQRRSSVNLKEGFEYVRSGELGPIRCVYAMMYRPRAGIERVEKPMPIPSSIDYNLWCGPAPMEPVMRKNLHYEWHWFWNTGNGEIGNNGPHTIDIARWALGQNELPPRTLSIGGRFGVDDGAQTPNTQIAFYDYQPAPLICEVRNYRATGKDIGKFRDTGKGVIVDCEGGYYMGDAAGGTVLDKQGKKIKDLGSSKENEETLHVANFVNSVRSRKRSELNAEAEVGHITAACCHLANISHRLGTSASPDEIRERVGQRSELKDAVQRCDGYLRANGIDLNKSPSVLGAWVTWNNEQHKFVGEFADGANQLMRSANRKPFEIPELV